MRGTRTTGVRGRGKKGYRKSDQRYGHKRCRQRLRIAGWEQDDNRASGGFRNLGDRRIASNYILLTSLQLAVVGLASGFPENALKQPLAELVLHHVVAVAAVRRI